METVNSKNVAFEMYSPFLISDFPLLGAQLRGTSLVKTSIILARPPHKMNAEQHRHTHIMSTRTTSIKINVGTQNQQRVDHLTVSSGVVSKMTA